MAVDTIARGMAASAQGGSSDYSDLTNKPSINSVTLSGNKTTSDLGISYTDLTNKPLFLAIYGTTTYAEVSAALAAHMEVIAVNTGSNYYYYYEKMDGTTIMFARHINNQIYRAGLTTGNSWSTGYLTNTFIESPDLPTTTSPAWGKCQNAGNVTPSITLPSFGYASIANSFVYTFVAATTGATFNAPTDAMLIDTEGTTTYTLGNSLVLSDLTVGNFYECNFTCYKWYNYTASRYDQYIVLVMKGYPVA